MLWEVSEGSETPIFSSCLGFISHMESAFNTRISSFHSYVWEHLEVGYVQGMCDLLAPLMVILDNGRKGFPLECAGILTEVFP